MLAFRSRCSGRWPDRPEAAQVIATAPGALQLRQLQTLAEISVTNSSTIVFPIPVELFETARSMISGAPSAQAVTPQVVMDSIADTDLADELLLPDLDDI